jgi:hypothetical protein
MTRYLVIHTTPADATQNQVIGAAKQLVASLPPGVEWLNSWVAGEAERLFCEWEAESEETLLAALEPIGEMFPIEAAHMVTWIDPAWYRE